MSGSVGPIIVCDRECAEANDCVIGGIECAGCGRYFCAYEVDGDGYCDKCADERDKEEDADDGE